MSVGPGETDAGASPTAARPGKAYFVQIYKTLDAKLSSETDLSTRTQDLCAAWDSVHSLCLHSSPSTHAHLLTWIQLHTARTILQTEWQLPKNAPIRAGLEAVLLSFKEDTTAVIHARGGSRNLWEIELMLYASNFRSLLSDPWSHPVLRSLLDPKGVQPPNSKILKWLVEERGVMFMARLRQLASSKCHDIALSLASAVLDRSRGNTAPDDTQESTGNENDRLGTPFAVRLRRSAGFTDEVWDFLTDIELVLLHKAGKTARCIDIVKQTALNNGYQLMERLKDRLEAAPNEKKLWKNAKEVATLVAQVIVTRCMVVPTCTGTCRAALYRCTRALVLLLDEARLPAVCGALAAPAATSRHLHTLAVAVESQIGQNMRPFVCELFVRAITAGMNELERLKLKTEKEDEARTIERTLAMWFLHLSSVLKDNVRIVNECILTAFSVHPINSMYDKLVNAPEIPRHEKEKTETVTSEFGSWATDSRSTKTNFVKTSETLNLKLTLQQANVLSTKVLAEGEKLGLSPELCQDLAVLLSGPRVKTLSWDMDRAEMLQNCRAYMERTESGTRTLTTELKFLNLDPSEYQHLPEEEDEDENDIYYGIEKGYEHLVELQQSSEEIWQPKHSDSEGTISCDWNSHSLKDLTTSNFKEHFDNEADPLFICSENAIQVHNIHKERNEKAHKKVKNKDKKSKRSKKITKDPLANEEVSSNCSSSKVAGDPNRLDKKKTCKRKERKKLERVARRKAKKEQRLMLNDCGSNAHLASSLSLNTHEVEPNVVFDGLFSMDDLKSVIPDASDKAKLAQPIMEIPTDAVKLTNSSTHSNIANPSMNSSTQAVHKLIENVPSTEYVKMNVRKLIEFRKQKGNNCHQNSNVNANLQENNDNQNDRAISSSNFQAKLKGNNLHQINRVIDSLDVHPRVGSITDNKKLNNSDAITYIKRNYPQLLQTNSISNKYKNTIVHETQTTKDPTQPLISRQRVSKNELLPKQTGSTQIPTVTKQPGIQSFLRDLHHTINAGTNNSQIHNPTKQTSDVLGNSSRNKLSIFQRNNSNTTYSKLNYLHKNKCNENLKSKQLSDAQKVILLQQSLSNLERDLEKIDKSKEKMQNGNQLGLTNTHVSSLIASHPAMSTMLKSESHLLYHKNVSKDASRTPTTSNVSKSSNNRTCDVKASSVAVPKANLAMDPINKTEDALKSTQTLNMQLAIQNRANVTQHSNIKHPNVSAVNTLNTVAKNSSINKKSNKSGGSVNVKKYKNQSSLNSGNAQDWEHVMDQLLSHRTSRNSLIPQTSLDQKHNLPINKLTETISRIPTQIPTTTAKINLHNSSANVLSNKETDDSDLLDELFDNDLLQEISELTSDEESYMEVVKTPVTSGQFTPLKSENQNLHISTSKYMNITPLHDKSKTSPLTTNQKKVVKSTDFEKPNIIKQNNTHISQNFDSSAFVESQTNKQVRSYLNMDHKFNSSQVFTTKSSTVSAVMPNINNYSHMLLRPTIQRPIDNDTVNTFVQNINAPRSTSDLMYYTRVVYNSVPAPQYVTLNENPAVGTYKVGQYLPSVTTTHIQVPSTSLSNQNFSTSREDNIYNGGNLTSKLYPNMSNAVVSPNFEQSQNVLIIEQKFNSSQDIRTSVITNNLSLERKIPNPPVKTNNLSFKQNVLIPPVIEQNVSIPPAKEQNVPIAPAITNNLPLQQNVSTPRIFTKGNVTITRGKFAGSHSNKLPQSIECNKPCKVKNIKPACTIKIGTNLLQTSDKICTDKHVVSTTKPVPPKRKTPTVRNRTNQNNTVVDKSSDIKSNDGRQTTHVTKFPSLDNNDIIYQQKIRNATSSFGFYKLKDNNKSHDNIQSSQLPVDNSNKTSSIDDKNHDLHTSKKINTDSNVNYSATTVNDVTQCTTGNKTADEFNTDNVKSRNHVIDDKKQSLETTSTQNLILIDFENELKGAQIFKSMTTSTRLSIDIDVSTCPKALKSLVNNDYNNEGLVYHSNNNTISNNTEIKVCRESLTESTKLKTIPNVENKQDSNIETYVCLERDSHSICVSETELHNDINMKEKLKNNSDNIEVKINSNILSRSNNTLMNQNLKVSPTNLHKTQIEISSEKKLRNRKVTIKQITTGEKCTKPKKTTKQDKAQSISATKNESKSTSIISEGDENRVVRNLICEEYIDSQKVTIEEKDNGFNLNNESISNEHIDSTSVIDTENCVKIISAKNADSGVQNERENKIAKVRESDKREVCTQFGYYKISQHFNSEKLLKLQRQLLMKCQVTLKKCTIFNQEINNLVTCNLSGDQVAQKDHLINPRKLCIEQGATGSEYKNESDFQHILTGDIGSKIIDFIDSKNKDTDFNTKDLLDVTGKIEGIVVNDSNSEDVEIIPASNNSIVSIDENFKQVQKVCELSNIEDYNSTTNFKHQIINGGSLPEKQKETNDVITIAENNTGDKVVPVTQSDVVSTLNQDALQVQHLSQDTTPKEGKKVVDLPDVQNKISDFINVTENNMDKVEVLPVTQNDVVSSHIQDPLSVQLPRHVIGPEEEVQNKFSDFIAVTENNKDNVEVLPVTQNDVVSSHIRDPLSVQRPRQVIRPEEEVQNKISDFIAVTENNKDNVEVLSVTQNDVVSSHIRDPLSVQRPRQVIRPEEEVQNKISNFIAVTENNTGGVEVVPINQNVVSAPSTDVFQVQQLSLDTRHVECKETVDLTDSNTGDVNVLPVIQTDVLSGHIKDALQVPRLRQDSKTEQCKIMVHLPDVQNKISDFIAVTENNIGDVEVLSVTQNDVPSSYIQDPLSVQLPRQIIRPEECKESVDLSVDDSQNNETFNTMYIGKVKIDSLPEFRVRDDGESTITNDVENSTDLKGKSNNLLIINDSVMSDNCNRDMLQSQNIKMTYDNDQNTDDIHLQEFTKEINPGGDNTENACLVINQTKHIVKRNSVNQVQLKNKVTDVEGVSNVVTLVNKALTTTDCKDTQKVSHIESIQRTISDNANESGNMSNPFTEIENIITLTDVCSDIAHPVVSSEKSNAEPSSYSPIPNKYQQDEFDSITKSEVSKHDNSINKNVDKVELCENVDDVIVLDDDDDESSNDEDIPYLKNKLEDLNPLILPDKHKNETKGDLDRITELRNELLEELSIFNSISKPFSDEVIVLSDSENEDNDKFKTRPCFVKLFRCDNMMNIKKQQTILKKCVVKVVRCDYRLQKNKTTQMQYIKHAFDTKRTSPIMNTYDIILKLQNITNASNIALLDPVKCNAEWLHNKSAYLKHWIDLKETSQVVDIKCDAEWFNTKTAYLNELKIQKDFENDHFTVPSLISIVLETLNKQIHILDRYTLNKLNCKINLKRKSKDKYVQRHRPPKVAKYSEDNINSQMIYSKSSDVEKGTKLKTLAKENFTERVDRCRLDKCLNGNSSCKCPKLPLPDLPLNLQSDSKHNFDKMHNEDLKSLYLKENINMTCENDNKTILSEDLHSCYVEDNDYNLKIDKNVAEYKENDITVSVEPFEYKHIINQNVSLLIHNDVNVKGVDRESLETFAEKQLSASIDNIVDSDVIKKYDSLDLKDTKYVKRNDLVSSPENDNGTKVNSSIEDHTYNKRLNESDCIPVTEDLHSCCMEKYDYNVKINENKKDHTITVSVEPLEDIDILGDSLSTFTNDEIIVERVDVDASETFNDIIYETCIKIGDEIEISHMVEDVSESNEHLKDKTILESSPKLNDNIKKSSDNKSKENICDIVDVRTFTKSFNYLNGGAHSNMTSWHTTQGIIHSVFKDNNIINNDGNLCKQVESFKLIKPYKTYSIKRKFKMEEVKVIRKKKFRYGKDINVGNALDRKSIENTSYKTEFTSLCEYNNALNYSVNAQFHSDCENIHKVLREWPINKNALVHCENVINVDTETRLYAEEEGVQNNIVDSKREKPFVEEISEDISKDYISTFKDEIVDMGFGEGSDRIIQNSVNGHIESTAAILSDVKRIQPFISSEDCKTNRININTVNDEFAIIRQHFHFLNVRAKIKSFFEKSAIELNEYGGKSKKHDVFRRVPGLYDTEFMIPRTTPYIVQVVQVGQLPLSAAAQNPVSCDSRVTPVTDASPSQCSVDNSPHSGMNDNAQTSNEYTELTNADLSIASITQELREAHESQTVISTSGQSTASPDTPLDTEEPRQNIDSSTSFNNNCNDIKVQPNENSSHEQHNNIDIQYDMSTSATSTGEPTLQLIFNNSQQNNFSEEFLQQKYENGFTEKSDQLANAMTAAGIATTNNRGHALVNIFSQKLVRPSEQTNQSITTSSTVNSYTKTTAINAVSLQQALAQILPPPLNHSGNDDQQIQGAQFTPQVLHIVQGKNATGNQITLVDNSQQSVITSPNAAQVLHIVQQNKSTNSALATNGAQMSQSNSYGGISLVDAGLHQGNSLLHIVNAGPNQKGNATGQLLKRVNLLTNLANVQATNEQKMVQFVCKSADGKSIQVNAAHQRSMVLRLQPIETSNVQAQQEVEGPVSSPTSSATMQKDSSQQEIKSRSVYEENYAKFIQNSSSKPSSAAGEKSTSLPKFNQAFGKPVFQDGVEQKQIEMASNDPQLQDLKQNADNSECSSDNSVNIEHIRQINSPPPMMRKSTAQCSQSQPSIVQQIKHNIAPMNIQTMHGGVIYTRQIPVNIGGGQTINLITVPSTELMEDPSQKHADVKFTVNQNEIEPSIIKIVPQTPAPNAEVNPEEGNPHMINSENQHPVLTQMRIKLPMLSKSPQMVPGTRVVRPSFFQIQRNVIGGSNQVYQQLVLTAAPPLGTQTIRLPQPQVARHVKVPTDNQSSESHLSSSTLEQLREFDMVLEQVKERSTVQPTGGLVNTVTQLAQNHSSDTVDSSTATTISTEHTQQVLYSIGGNQALNVAYVNRKTITSTPSTFARSPDSSGVADSPTSSQVSHVVHEPRPETHHKPTRTSSRPRPRPSRISASLPSALKMAVPPKTSTQKPLEDEQTTQRILYILAEYKEQVENSPDKDKPAPRRRAHHLAHTGGSKRKKGGSRRPGATRESSPAGDDASRTIGSEDSSCGTSQGDCNESCLDAQSPQGSPRKVARKLAYDREPEPQPAPQPQLQPQPQPRPQTVVTRGKPATVLMPANYILPVSVVKGGQQIAIVTNRGPKLVAVGEGGAANALLLQRVVGPAALKPMLTRPAVRHVRLPLHALGLAPAPSAAATYSASACSPDQYLYDDPAATPRSDRTVLDTMPGRYSPDMEAQRIFDKMFDTKKTFIVEPHGQSPRVGHGYDLDGSHSDSDDKVYQQVVHKKEHGSTSHGGLHRVSAAALRHKYAVLEHELRLQKSLSEECEDLGVDSPSASELFPEAELLFAGSPAQDHAQDPSHSNHTIHTTTILNQSTVSQPDLEDQLATDHVIPKPSEHDDRRDDLAANLGLEDVGIVTVSEDGLQTTIALDHEEFARSHPNTTFHRETTDDAEVQPFTLADLKSRHITSTIFHSHSAATVLMAAPTTHTVISQATVPNNTVKYTDIDNIIDSLPGPHNPTELTNLSSVLVKDSRFDSILHNREVHLANATSAIVHAAGTTQVIRRVCYEDEKIRDPRFLIDEPESVIAGDDPKMTAVEDTSRDATLVTVGCDVEDDRCSPERHAELFWEESRRPIDFSSDSDKCCKSPSYDETNSTDSSFGPMRLDSVIKEARSRKRSGSADGSSADDTNHPPLRTYPPKRTFHPDSERSLTGKTRAGESPDNRRRASGRGVVKRGCHCCNGSPAPSRPKKPRQRKPTMDFTLSN